MPSFGKTSKARLSECHPDLQKVFNEVVKTFDCSVITGHREAAEQNQMFNVGRSQLRYPKSKHNTYPSRAVDVIPYPVDWADRERMHYFAGYVLATAKSMGIGLRWGGDWDMDMEIADNSFDDLPHFELV